MNPKQAINIKLERKAKRISQFFMLVAITLISLTTIIGAQTMSKNEKDKGSKQTLSVQERHIVKISAFTAIGELAPLKTAFSEGLESGLTINEIKEVLIQLYAYCGFPRSLNGINTLMEVVYERQKAGINDPMGKRPKLIGANQDRYEIGKANLTKLSGVEAPTTPTGYAAFVPTIDVFLKEHLFADIFARGVLDFKTREIVTISALSSMNGVGDQLRSHLRIGLHTGLSEAELRALIKIIHTEIGAEQSEKANAFLTEVINQR